MIMAKSNEIIWYLACKYTVSISYCYHHLYTPAEKHLLWGHVWSLSEGYSHGPPHCHW